MSSKIRHEWYQTDSEVVLSVFIRNVKAEDLKVDLQDRSVSLTVHLPTGTDVVFDLDPLAHAVDVAGSSHRVNPAKIEIKLKKKQPGIKWAKIEGEDEGVPASTGAATGTSGEHSYPSSSKKHTNWDALARAAAEEEEKGKTAAGKDSNAGGDKQLNELFQKLYADATDEQRRAMIKSYQESNGTALSTDWNEVKKAPVKTQPPESMVAKKWGA
uniref:Suppressor of G2 allele of SKP1-like protein n=1 Tax=Glaciozyma antarctica TaxID=105987 RepID=A0A0S3J4V5_9BASI|nr:suppressor of G2 allele of SKP1-like protein [Glaciozyma antarctica]